MRRKLLGYSRLAGLQCHPKFNAAKPRTQIARHDDAEAEDAVSDCDEDVKEA
jgi:hypothetical protein